MAEQLIIAAIVLAAAAFIARKVWHTITSARAARGGGCDSGCGCAPAAAPAAAPATRPQSDSTRTTATR